MVSERRLRQTLEAPRQEMPADVIRDRSEEGRAADSYTPTRREQDSLPPQQNANENAQDNAQETPRDAYLPPYVRREETEQGTMYIFLVPAAVRPEGFERATTLGLVEHKNGNIGAVVDKAWAMFGQLQAARREEELRLVRDTLKPTTLEQTIREYQERDNGAMSQYLAGAAIAAAPDPGQVGYAAYDPNAPHPILDDYIEQLKDMAAHTPDKPLYEYNSADIQAYIRNSGETYEERAHAREAAMAVFAYGLREGYIERNIVRDIRLRRSSVTRSQPAAGRDLAATMADSAVSAPQPGPQDHLAPAPDGPEPPAPK